MKKVHYPMLKPLFPCMSTRKAASCRVIKALKVLLKYGLRYGELACFHRYSEDGSKLLFSVLQMTDMVWKVLIWKLCRPKK